MTTKWVLFYESADNVAELAPLHFAAHKARIDEFHARGDLLLVGITPEDSGAMAVFRTREAAEEFHTADPFVLNGVVTHHRIREWREILG